MDREWGVGRIRNIGCTHSQNGDWEDIGILWFHLKMEWISHFTRRFTFSLSLSNQYRRRRRVAMRWRERRAVTKTMSLCSLHATITTSQQWQPVSLSAPQYSYHATTFYDTSPIWSQEGTDGRTPKEMEGESCSEEEGGKVAETRRERKRKKKTRVGKNRYASPPLPLSPSSLPAF